MSELILGNILKHTADLVNGKDNTAAGGKLDKIEYSLSDPPALIEQVLISETVCQKSQPKKVGMDPGHL